MQRTASKLSEVYNQGIKHPDVKGLAGGCSLANSSSVHGEYTAVIHKFDTMFMKFFIQEWQLSTFHTDAEPLSDQNV